MLKETAKAVQLSYSSDSEYGEGEVQAWFPKRSVGLREDAISGLTCDWCAGWLGDKLASGDHSAVLIVG